MKSGFSDPRLFPLLRPYAGILRLEEKPDNSYKIVSTEPISAKLANLSPEEVTAMIRAGKRLNIYRSMFGTLTYNYLDPINPFHNIDNASDYRSVGTVPHYGGMVYVRDGPLPREEGFEIISPIDGATISGPSIRVEGTSNGLPRIDVQIGTNPVKQATINRTTGDWSVLGRTTTEGQHTITATATYGRPTATAHEKRLTINVSFGQPSDTTPPTIQITSPADGTTISGSASGVRVDVSGSASGVGSGIRMVELRLDNIPGYTPAAPRAPGDWSSWSGSLLISGAGLHSITARATDMAGNTSASLIRISVSFVQPFSRLLLVEICRLSSFLGNYGAGRVVKTFSLLPGEKTKISVRTYTKRETTRADATSILDSFEDKSSQTFEDSVANEQSDKQNFDEHFAYNVKEHADAGWGWGHASVDATQSGSTNSAREEFAKNTSSALQKHASEKSAKRDVQVNTSYEEKEIEEEETSIERELANVNLSRTLNFVFRQMNQEFISILHLVDIRVGFFQLSFDASGEEQTKYKEVSLPQLDSLLENVLIPDRNTIDYVRTTILTQITSIFDYKDEQHTDFVTTANLRDRNGNEVPGYLRVKRDYISTYTDLTVPPPGIPVPGIILNVSKNTLRTEGIIVDALLGQGEALDEYAKHLQELEVSRREAEVAKATAEGDRAALINQLTRDNGQAGAKILADLTCPCGPDRPVLDVNVHSKDSGAPT